MDQVVDTDTAREFMGETLEKVEPEELEQICSEVEAKSAWFREKLGPGAVADLTREDYAAVLRRIFSTRGKTRRVLEGVEFEPMRDRIAELLAGQAPVALLEGKRVIDDGLDAALSAGLTMEQRVLGALFATDDGKEGIAAFMEKRDPKFKGR